jgi:ATPase subunit of ABC transporter with duplicated ATPase domains
VSFPGRPSLRDVSLEVRLGERVLISGPNGAGKTTLLRALAGQLRPDAGQVSGARGTALLPQRHDDLPAGATVLGYLRSRLPRQSPVLLLDEPTHYLDFDALDIVEAALRAYPGTLVMVTHDRYFADRVGFTRQLLVSNGTVTPGARGSAPGPAPQPGAAACLAL